MRYRNTSGMPRVWPAITNPATGTTLALGPDETATLDLGRDFHDPWLTPEPARHKPKTTDPDDDAKD